jgi:hypothetical protein
MVLKIREMLRQHQDFMIRSWRAKMASPALDTLHKGSHLFSNRL